MRAHKDTRAHLDAALARAWQRHAEGGERDAELDRAVVEALAEVVDRRLGRLSAELLERTPRLKSVLFERLEAALFKEPARPGDVHLFVFPEPGPALEQARGRGDGAGWGLQWRREPLPKRTLLEAEARLCPPGTRLEALRSEDGERVVGCRVSVPLGDLSRRRHRVTLVLPSERGFDLGCTLPMIREVRTDQWVSEVPESYGGARGEWLRPGGPLELRWWTEPGPSAHTDEPGLRWLGEQGAVGDFTACVLELQIDVLAWGAFCRRRGARTDARELSVELEIPSGMGARAVFGDVFRVRTNPSRELPEAYRRLFGARFAEIARPGHWQLWGDAGRLRPEATMISRPQIEGSAIPELPLERRRLLRARAGVGPGLVTLEEIADAADAALAGRGRVDRSRVRGAPTWLEGDERLREREGLEELAGFIWVVPVLGLDGAPRAQADLRSVEASLGRRLPVGSRLVLVAEEEP